MMQIRTIFGRKIGFVGEFREHGQGGFGLVRCAGDGLLSGDLFFGGH
jgi:hypothetical protein